MRQLERMMHPTYKLTETETDDQWLIQITEGKLDGLLFKFGKVQFKEDDGEFATLQFEYDVVEPIEHRLTKEEVDAIIGSILYNIIEESVEYNNERNNRVDDPQAVSN